MLFRYYFHESAHLIVQFQELDGLHVAFQQQEVYSDGGVGLWTNASPTLPTDGTTEEDLLEYGMALAGAFHSLGW